MHRFTCMLLIFYFTFYQKYHTFEKSKFCNYIEYCFLQDRFTWWRRRTVLVMYQTVCHVNSTVIKCLIKTFRGQNLHTCPDRRAFSASVNLARTIGQNLHKVRWIRYIFFVFVAIVYQCYCGALRRTNDCYWNDRATSLFNFCWLVSSF